MYRFKCSKGISGWMGMVDGWMGGWVLKSLGGHPNMKSHEAMDIFCRSVSPPPPSTDTKGGVLSLNWPFRAKKNCFIVNSIVFESPL